MRKKPETTKEVLAFCSLNELSFLKHLMASPALTGYARTQGEGSCAGTLRTKGLIKPMGQVGNKLRWQLNENVIHKDERDFIKELLGITLG